ncbi:30S ribosomal protein S13 [Candidatus Uhrbacteria bacterium]|nr:30S ribosomal protein S13 [Candidatus Uhrbacteria bacterium]
MARILGVTLPRDKRIIIGLTYIFGIGPARAQRVLELTQVDEKTRVKDLTEDETNKIRSIIEKEYRVEGELRREVQSNVKRLKDIGTYRGTRHSKRLPARGQRTKTNSRTNRGNVRSTAGSGRRSVAKK